MSSREVAAADSAADSREQLVAETVADGETHASPSPVVVSTETSSLQAPHVSESQKQTVDHVKQTVEATEQVTPKDISTEAQTTVMPQSAPGEPATMPAGFQSIEQFNGQAQIQFPQSGFHGQHPYYHDPTVHAQYHHPQAGYMNQIPNPPGTKAKRKRASPHQLALLNQIFEYTYFPSTELRNEIGKELNMAPRTVQIWFQNRRQNWKVQKQRDGAPELSRANDNERGGWEVLRSFQARRANGEIQEYEYMSIPAPNGANSDATGGSNGYSRVPYHTGMMQVALSSNDQFNSSMQQVPMPLPHRPHPNTQHQPPQQEARSVPVAFPHPIATTEVAPS